MTTKQQRVMLARSIDKNIERVALALEAAQEAQAHNSLAFARECRALAMAASHLAQKAETMAALEAL